MIVLVCAALALSAEFLCAQSPDAAGGVDKARSLKRVLFLGDSITDKRHIGCTTNYWGFLGEWYGFTPLVYGVNGQQWVHIRDQVEAYRKDHAEDPDVVFVFAGTNDYNSNVPLGEWYKVTEEKTNRNGREVILKKRTPTIGGTLRGRINVTILSLRKNFPNARIVLLAPLHRGLAKFGKTNVQPDEAYANELGLFIDDYVAAIKEAGNVWSVRVVDLNADAELYPSSPAHDRFVHNAEWDRLHPSDAGHERIAEVIAMKVGDLLK